METTSLTAPPPDPAAAPPDGGPGTRPGRRWAAVGVLAGATGMVSVLASMEVGAALGTDAFDDAVEQTERLRDAVPQLLVFHVATVLTALLLVVVAPGLERRLAGALPGGSLLPRIAYGGLLLVAVAALLGSGLNTEFLFAIGQDGGVVPENVAFFLHWVATIPWLWVGAGVAALAVAAASLRAGALARWLGWTSLVLGGLVVLVGISPLQYMAGFLGPLWLLVAMLGLARERRPADR